MANQGKFTTVQSWDAALEAEFTSMTPMEARAALRRLRYSGGPLTDHDGQFRRLTAVARNVGPEEGVLAYTNTFEGYPDVVRHLMRAHPADWEAAAKLARSELGILAATGGTTVTAGLAAAAPAAVPPTRGGQQQLRYMGMQPPYTAGAPTTQGAELATLLERMQETLAFMDSRSRQQVQPLIRPPPTAQQVGLSEQEYERRLRLRLCFKCGQPFCWYTRCGRQLGQRQHGQGPTPPPLGPPKPQTN